MLNSVPSAYMDMTTFCVGYHCSMLLEKRGSKGRRGEGGRDGGRGAKGPMGAANELTTCVS